jgi:DNA-binding CsgD family transcriptional regulator/catechol 2,3-dioxygenase-like lactoylglutathione lyase family enzyme
MPRTTRRGRPPHRDVLTPTEWRILHAVQHGMTNVQIARRRGTSIDAVKFHVANVLAKLGVRNRRELRKLSPKPADSALRRKPAGITGSVRGLAGLGQVARTVRDVTESERWYRDVLGLPHLYTFGSLAFFDMCGTRLMLSQAEAVASADSLLYFLVPDIEAAHRLLESRGVEFLNAPHMIHRHADGAEEWMCFFKDLEGRPLALMSRPTPLVRTGPATPWLREP